MLKRFVAVALCIASLASVFAQDAPPGRRVMNKSKPLVQQFDSSDSSVEIAVNQGEPSYFSPSRGTSWERFQSDVSDFVVVVRVESTLPHLVYRVDMDSDLELLEFSTKSESADENRANWIMSTIRARVERVLKGKDVIEPSTQLRFEEDGGTLVLRGVQVRAVVPWETPLTPGKRYLWFGSVASYGKMWRNAMYVEPAPGAPLVSVTNHGRGRRLEGLRLDDAIAYVEGEMKK
jgi:hypothetical protein